MNRPPKVRFFLSNFWGAVQYGLLFDSVKVLSIGKDKPNLTKTPKDSIMYSYELVRMPDASYRKSLNKLLGLFRAL